MTRPARRFSLVLRRLLVRAAGPAQIAARGPGRRAGRDPAGDPQARPLFRWSLRAAAALAAAFCLLWPALLNGQAIFFYDTIGYLRGAAQAFHAAGIDSDWSAFYGRAAAPASAEGAPSAAPATDGFISAARSVYYGAALYLGELLGSLWLAVLFQLCAVALAVGLALHALLGAPRRELPVILCTLGLFTPLSFFTSYLMPDVFAGIVILACACLLVCYDRLDWRTRSLWFALLCISLTFHLSFIVAAALLSLAGVLLVRGATGRFPWAAAGVIQGAVAVGLLAQAAFFRTVEAVYGHPPLHPPFLMARMVADGPGYDYLRQTCPDNGFKLCEFLPVLPLGTDDFLWSKDPQAGVIGPADPETRRILVGQQMAFAGAVLRHDPARQIRASASGFLEQLSRFSVSEFRYTEPMRKMVTAHLPAVERARFSGSLLYKDRFPLAAADTAFLCALGAGMVLLVWSLLIIRGNARSPLPHHPSTSGNDLLVFAYVVLSGIAVNAAVTGVLSAPHDRYQARVIWLVLFLALAALAFLRRQRGARPVLQRTPAR